jgi:hypothetical protein
MLKKHTKENEKIDKLKTQNAETYQDYLYFLTTREEAKKQLEAKFQDIYKKIEKLKEAMNSEAIRVNDCLKAFQTKFNFLIKELETNMVKQINDEKEFTRNKFKEHQNEMSRLEQMIIEEREERLRQTDEQLKPIRSDIVKLFKEQENERQERVQNEKDTMRCINDNVFEINENIDKESNERNIKMTVLKEEFTQEIKARDHSFAEFQKAIMNDIKVVKDEINSEMDNRFSHQDEIIDNISNFMKTFQETLKILGKDV